MAGPFVVVSSDNIATAMSSDAGLTYTNRSIPGNTRYSGVTFCRGIGRFLAVNGGGSVSQWANSTDGFSWAAQAVGLSGAQCVGWSPELKIAVAYANVTNSMAWATDPLTSWTAIGSGSVQCSTSSTGGHALCWSKEKALFVAVGNASGTNQYSTSPDGKVFTGNTASAYNGTAIAWGGDGKGGGAQRFIAVGTGNVVRTSTIGTGSWTNEAFAVSPGNTAVDIAYSPSLNRFVVCGNNGTINTREGAAATWTSRAISNHTWHSICWSVDLALFVVVADDGAVATSTDGLTWIDRTASSIQAWTSVSVVELIPPRPRRSAITNFR